MKFKSELIPKVLSGEKTVTRRPLYTSWWYRIGQRTRIKDERGEIYGWIRILSVKEETLGDIKHYNEDEVRREGFTSLEEFFNFWQKLYGRVNFDMRVRRIEFKLEL